MNIAFAPRRIGPVLAIVIACLVSPAFAQRYEDPPPRVEYPEGFYEELADHEPDRDDFRYEAEPGWDYDPYGAERWGIHSPYRFNYGPYNTPPAHTRERFQYTPGEAYDGWVKRDDLPKDRRYWYEIHDHEPDRDDYLRRFDLDFYDPDERTVLSPDLDADPDEEFYEEGYLDELTRPEYLPDARRPLRDRAERRVPSDAPPVTNDPRRRFRTYTGEVVELVAVMAAEARPQGVVVTMEDRRGERIQVYFTGESDIANPQKWLWPDELLAVQGNLVKIDGRKVIQAESVHPVNSDFSRGQRSETAQRASIAQRGHLRDIYSVRTVRGEVTALLGKLEAADKKTVPVLLGTRDELLGEAGALISPGEQIEVIGQARRMDRQSLILARDVRLLREE